MRHKLRNTWLCILVLTIAASTGSWAGIVTYTIADLGGGLFQYNLTLNNPGLAEPISGLNILNGNSVFGLDFTSVISAPQDVGGNPTADWLFFEPFPPFADELNYFSLAPAGDVPINGSLGGFFFQSTTNPLTINDGDFAVEVIFASGIPGPTEDAQLGNVQPIPEPSTLLSLVTIGIIGTVVYIRRRKEHTI